MFYSPIFFSVSTKKIATSPVKCGMNMDVITYPSGQWSYPERFERSGPVPDDNKIRQNSNRTHNSWDVHHYTETISTVSNSNFSVKLHRHLDAYWLGVKLCMLLSSTQYECLGVKILIITGADIDKKRPCLTKSSFIYIPCISSMFLSQIHNSFRNLLFSSAYGFKR